MHDNRRELNILTWDAKQMRKEVIAKALISAWSGSKFVIIRLADFTADRMRAASTHIGRRLRHE